MNNPQTAKKPVRKPRGGSEKMASMFLPEHADLMVGTCPKCGFNPREKYDVNR
jgi:hypothetical protein